MSFESPCNPLAQKTSPQSQFMKWSSYNGCLFKEPASEELASCLYGFENLHSAEPLECLIPHLGTAYGFVSSGRVEVRSKNLEQVVRAGQWFCIPQGFTARLDHGARLSVMIRQNYHGLFGVGGPVESTGRLRYIDGCSDTLLFGPHLLGDPCFNILYFPKAVSQTPHTHPSTRLGMVVSGAGTCELGEESIPLNPGDIFYIPPYLVHCFRTKESTLTVVAYHPDSDWGPQHEDHPMINRTWVDGKKIELTATH